MPSGVACPKCGSPEAERTQRKGPWEHLISGVDLHPYSCQECGHRFLRNRRGSGFGYLMATVWLVGVVALAGAALWFWQVRPLPALPVQAAARPNQQQLNQLRSGNQLLRESLSELRQAVGQLAREKAALQQELASVSRSLAAAIKAQAPQPSPENRPRLEQLNSQNAELRSDLEKHQRALSDLNQQKEALQDLLAQKASAPRPAKTARGLVATVSFGPGRTQLEPQARAQLSQAVGRLRAQPQHAIVVEGNADSTPLGTATAKLYYDNAGVALARALSVFRALRDLGVDPLRMEVRASGAPAKGPDAGRTVSVYLVESPG